ncbi:MAG: hypothetical protein KJ914_03725 [Gammaproteobacteria bacterium]|nr:hypothetical protein [Gammaproteobacteria bacterium]MBU1722646.1 hypothetical protein [Gammaproteobacteria bacterium]MBU2006693.1 hypothetical protein [Gammaproteobacteria bacterium]
MKVKGLRYVIVSVTALAALFVTVASANAAIRSEQPANVTLVATLNEGPAMRPVRWTVYRLDNNNRPIPVTSFRRHSASIVLEPGRYRAEANLNNVNRSRVFDVSRRSSSSVVVAMD